MVLLLAAATAHGQEAMYTQAATMPSPGTGVVREQVHLVQYGSSPDGSVRETQDVVWSSHIAYGLARGLSVSLEVPVVFGTSKGADGRDDHDKGVEDLEVMFKYRLFKHDGGGVDTIRAAVIGGAAVASGDDHDYSSQSVNPHIGLVLTAVRGRFGFNQDLIYRFNTGGDAWENTGTNGGGHGPSDALLAGSALLYRLAPATFTEDSHGAWYLTAELNAIYETNGDLELLGAPGIMYEGRQFAFELMVQLPVADDLDHRAELDLGFGVGLRLAF